MSLCAQASAEVRRKALVPTCNERGCELTKTSSNRVQISLPRGFGFSRVLGMPDWPWQILESPNSHYIPLSMPGGDRQRLLVDRLAALTRLRNADCTVHRVITSKTDKRCDGIVAASVGEGVS